MQLAPQLRTLVEQFAALEVRAQNQGDLLDSLSDLHNDLTDWATNTEHERAALEVMAILEQHIQRSKAGQNSVNSTDVPVNALDDIVVDAHSVNADG